MTRQPPAGALLLAPAEQALARTDSSRHEYEVRRYTIDTKDINVHSKQTRSSREGE